MIDRLKRCAIDKQPTNLEIAEEGQIVIRSSSLRVGLALARAVLLYILFCWLVMVIGLQMRDAREHGWGLDASATPFNAFRTENQPLPNTFESSASSLGLPFVGITVELDAMSAAERSRALTRLSDHGIGWSRQRFDWNSLEPEPGVFDWHSADAIVAAISESDLTPIAVLDGSPAWARHRQDRPPSDNPFAPPANPETFARFAAEFAQRYGDQVRFYQIWHEPNIAPHWGNRHIAPTDYAQLLIEASRAIRSVDDDAVIIAGALAPTTDRGHTAIDEVFFLQRMYAAGVKSHVDMLAIEPFGFGYSAQDPAQRPTVLNFQRAALVRRAIVAAGDGSTPLLAARFGWNQRLESPWRTVVPAEQQAHLGDALDIAWRQWPWLVGLGWAIDQPDSPTNDPLWGFALNDTLIETIGTWTGEASAARIGYAVTMPWGLILALAALAVVLWRTGSALRILPWSTWRTAYQNLRPAIKGLLWLLLIVLYFFATWPLLILFLMIMASVLIVMQPNVGLYLAAALLPFHFQHKELHLVDLSLSIPPATVVVLVSLPAIIGCLKHNLRQYGASTLVWTLQPLDWFGIGWLGISLLTMFNVWHWPGYRSGMLELVIVPLLLYSMVRLFATDRRSQTLTAMALLAGGILVATIGLAGWAGGSGTNVDSVRRLVGPYFSPNHAALYLERSLLLGLGFRLFWKSNTETRIRDWPKRMEFYLLVSIVGIGAALLLTASRGALLLGMPIGLGLFTWLAFSARTDPPHKHGQASTGDSGRRWASLAVAGLILAVVITVVFWPRLSNTATVVERIGVWKASLALWRSFPVFGVGPGGFYWRFPEYIPIGSSLDPNLRHPHSIWLESMTMWGGIGMIWLLALIGWGMRRIQQERRILRMAPQSGIIIGLLAGLAAGIAHGQVDAFGTLADIAGWNWLALGLWQAMVHEGLLSKQKGWTSQMEVQPSGVDITSSQVGRKAA